MDYSMNTLCGYSDGMKTDNNMFSSFPTPVNRNKTYTANTLTPGAIPSPLNFPSITPPSSPFSYYGLYSPSSTPRVSPLYDPMYLKRLKSNPMFRDLQTLLRQECLQMQVPANLITTSWNLMELHKPTNEKPGDNETTNQNSKSSMMPPPTSTGLTNQRQESTNSNSENKLSSGQQVYMCHMRLQDKLLKVRIDPAISADGLSVENDYSKEVGNTEMERYRALNSCPDDNVKDTINSYYDKQRLKLAEKTGEELDKLIVKAEEMRRNAQHNTNANQPTSVTVNKVTERVKQDTLNESNQGASLLLSPIEDKLNAVRKLKFNTSDDNITEHNNECKVDHPSAAADVNDDDDYLNCSVNSEDFEIDEIDVETVDKQTESNNPPQPINIAGSDLLKQCIQESGLGSLNTLTTQNDILCSPPVAGYTNSPQSDHNDHHGDQSVCDSTLPDSSTTSSPISMPSPDQPANQSSVFEPTNQNASINSTPGTNASFKKEEFIPRPPVNFDFGQFFSAPHNNNYKFVQPETLNSALSAMQKLCGGPSVSFSPELRREVSGSMFTPELRRDMSAPVFTPEYQKQFNPAYDHYSPMNYNNVNNISTGVPMRQSTECPTKQQKPTTANHRPSPPPNVTVLPKTMTTDSRNNNINLNDNNNNRGVVNSTVTKETEEFKFENTPVFKTHRMLTAESTNILSQWYHNNVQYPYPNDQQVEELSRLTGITGRQVKKWMANKRVRCFNTLSITGNQHPIKYKYQGKGRKRKNTETEKENCDSTTNDHRTNDSRVNYAQLSDQAKDILNQWYEDHVNNPYPTTEEKDKLAVTCGISVSQVKSWFANKRNRTNNTKRQVPNYFIEKFPEYSHIVHFVGQKREEERLLKRRKTNENMYIQAPFYF